MHWEPREGSGFPKTYKAPYGNVQAQLSTDKKATKLRLQHRYTNKIPKEKNLTKSITSKS